MTKRGILAKYETLMRQWAETLVDGGLFEYADARQYRVLGAPRDNTRQIAIRLDRFAVNPAVGGPEADALIDWIALCAEWQLPMLTGEVDPLEILFPDGDYRRANSLYRLNPLSGLVRWDRRKADRAGFGSFEETLRVMEVGAGTGGTTAYLLPFLDPERTRYLFTDLSDFFLTLTRSNFLNSVF